jgi:hypothetical protein
LSSAPKTNPLSYHRQACNFIVWCNNEHGRLVSVAPNDASTRMRFFKKEQIALFPNSTRHFPQEAWHLFHRNRQVMRALFKS